MIKLKVVPDPLILSPSERVLGGVPWRPWHSPPDITLLDIQRQQIELGMITIDEARAQMMGEL